MAGLVLFSNNEAAKNLTKPGQTKFYYQMVYVLQYHRRNIL